MLILSFNFSTLNAQNYNFRKSSWGDTKEQVKLNEKSELIQDANGLLIYNSVLEKLPCKIYFFFSPDNKLLQSKYVFTTNYSDLNMFIQDFKKFKSLLNEKYGNPTIDEEQWNVQHYTANENVWGESLLKGDLSFETNWINSKTGVKLEMSLDQKDKRIYLEINYTSQQYQKAYEQRKKNQLLDNL